MQQMDDTVFFGCCVSICVRRLLKSSLLPFTNYSPLAFATFATSQSSKGAGQGRTELVGLLAAWRKSNLVTDRSGAGLTSQASVGFQAVRVLGLWPSCQDDVFVSQTLAVEIAHLGGCIRTRQQRSPSRGRGIYQHLQWVQHQGGPGQALPF